MLGKGLESLIPPKQNKPEPEKPTLPHDEGVSIAPPQAQGAEEKEAGRNFSPMREEFKAAMARPDFSEEKNNSRAPHQPSRPHQKKSEGAIFQIEVEKIKANPYQPRRHFDEVAIKELAASIRDFGFLQPLVVSKVNQETPGGIHVEYQLIAGERRLLAAKYLGLDRVPALVREVDQDRERLELAIIENLQRENLNPIEMGRAMSRLQDEFRLTQREIATRLGKSRETVANTMRLLDLPSAIQEALTKNLITETHGRLLLAISDPKAQHALFEDLLHQRLSTRELKDRVQEKRSGNETAPSLSPELSSLQEKLSSRLGAPVKISHNGNPSAGGGKITISFYSKEELDSLINRLGDEGSGEEF